MNCPECCDDAQNTIEISKDNICPQCNHEWLIKDLGMKIK